MIDVIKSDENLWFGRCFHYLRIFCLFKGEDKPEKGNIVAQEEPTLRKESRELPIVCRSCGNIITSEAQKREVNDRHVHTFFNPQGVVFEFGCFASAPGCVVHGTPTPEFSWFKGLSWSFSTCRKCGEHLGWHYQAGGEGSFYGLILKKLIEQK